MALCGHAVRCTATRTRYTGSLMVADEPRDVRRHYGAAEIASIRSPVC
jgi:hypothetical protein